MFLFIILRVRSMLLLKFFDAFTFVESMLLFRESFWRFLFFEVLSICFWTYLTDILLVLMGWKPLKLRALLRLIYGSLQFFLISLLFYSFTLDCYSIAFLGEWAKVKDSFCILTVVFCGLVVAAASLLIEFLCSD